MHPFLWQQVRRGEHDAFTDKDLHDAFAYYGEIAHAEMIRDSLTGEPCCLEVGQLMQS